MPDKQIVIRVCNHDSCVKKGSVGIMQKIEQAIGLVAGKKNLAYDLEYSDCVGCCDFGPNLLVNNNLVLGANKDTVMEEIAKAAETVALTAEEKEANLNKVLEEDILNSLI